MADVYFYQDCVAELYPFTEVELGFYKDVLNFRHVSANSNIEWSYGMIKEFEDLWDWDILDSNRAVFERVALGLLFPHRAKLPRCDCFRMEDFCEETSCWVNARRLGYRPDLYHRDSKVYVRVAILCDTGLLDRDIIFDLYFNEDKTYLEEFIRFFIREDI